ncbi:MAG: flavodoxin family protein [Candidatus Methanoplasma sp.]|jgi:multimeric flavodoxin WrbA|nr:flavodoxin family protein [Candidatus Methanoplasma sp.]
MKALLINGSPREGGNTSELVKQFMNAACGKADIEEVRIFGKDISGCNNCGTCQKTILREHCTISDDMSDLYPKFISSDLIIFASPIYMWQFTPCTLAFINRLHCLCWSSDLEYNEMAGKSMAVLITSSDAEDAADLAAAGLREFCGFFSISYKGDLRIPFAGKSRISSGEYDGEIREFIGRVFR